MFIPLGNKQINTFSQFADQRTSPRNGVKDRNGTSFFLQSSATLVRKRGWKNGHISHEGDMPFLRGMGGGDLYRATLVVYRSSQARGQTRDAAPGLHHSHSNVCNLHHSSWQSYTLNPLRKAKDWTHVITDTSQVGYHWATAETPNMQYFLRPQKVISWVPLRLTGCSRCQPSTDLRNNVLGIGNTYAMAMNRTECSMFIELKDILTRVLTGKGMSV